MGAPIRITPPVLTDSAGNIAYPVTLAEVRSFIRIPADVHQDDAELNGLIQAAIERFEHVSDRACITQCWQLNLDSFWGPSWDYTFGATSGGGESQYTYFEPRAGWIIQLPKPPLQEVLSIQYIDGNGNLQTLAASQYIVDSTSEPARLSPLFGKFWPVARRQANAVTIQFRCGYSNDGSQVPAQVKEAIKRCVAYSYTHKTEFDEDWINHLFDRFAYGGC